MSVKKFPLGELCTISKGATGIQKAISGQYPLVVTGEDRKSHNEYQFDADAVIIPLVSGTGHGHASIKRIHYQTGKFALGSILCAVIPKDKAILNAEYLYYFLELNRENELVARMRGMANVTLPIKEIAQIKIPLPDLPAQIDFVKMYKWLSKKSNELSYELNHQLNLIKKLRQQLLQDAIQGKLIEQDPNDEPASVLLQKIKAEKEQLVKDKKLKKEKELPPIKVEEIPFDIPGSWTWCRLGEICNNITKGSSPNWQGVKYVKEGEGILYITSKNIDSYEIDLRKATYVEEKFNQIEPRSILKKGDILTNIVGASIGRTALYTLDTAANINQAVCILRIEYERFNKMYLLYLLNSDFALKMMADNQFAPGRANLSMSNISNFPIPLPSLREQNHITAKIEHILQTCDTLEANIKHSQLQNEQLLQQVLREALTKKFELEAQVEEGTVIQLATDEKYKSLLLAAEIIWQLNQQPTLGRLKLQKLIFLCDRTQQMHLPIIFLKQAMGPYSFELETYLETELAERHWFKHDEKAKLKFEPLKNAGGHRPDYDKYFSENKSAINHLLQLFENARSAQIEVVATLFACWEEMIADHQLVNDESLLHKFYNWHEKKQKHSKEKVINALRWMEEHGITPKKN